MAKVAAAEKVEEAKVVQLRRLEELTIRVPIEGMSPVIPHKWSEKSLNAMRDKQMSGSKKVATQRSPKEPEQDAHDSCYWLGDSPAMPATAFKAATVGACRHYEKPLTMTFAKTLIFIVGEGLEQLVKIKGDPSMREDTPRNSNGGVDLRYRMQIWPWSAVLEVRYLPSAIDEESIIALIDAGGRGGVGDWRPSSPKSHTGTYGVYKVAT